jgi:DNA-binding response OmpR family regulator
MVKKDKEEIILVVEDDKGLNNLMIKTIQEMGYNAVGAFTGRDGIFIKYFTG